MPSRESTPRERESAPRLQGLLGVGLDNRDGHSRLTKGDDFVLVGGSAETHERMQDLVARMNEKLRQQGRNLRDLSRGEFEDLARETFE
jgi:hypothetical protein